MRTLHASKMRSLPTVYLIDTNVISEARKGRRANPGVRSFFDRAARQESELFLSVVTIGELRRGVDLIRHRGDLPQAALLEAWLGTILRDYGDRLLNLDADVSLVWGRLRVPHAENALDKQIAATALVYDLTLVTRNTKDFETTPARTLNPFSSARV